LAAGVLAFWSLPMMIVTDVGTIIIRLRDIN